MPENNRETFAATNYIIKQLAENKINDLTNLKLQKLLYLAYGFHLSLFGEKLFDEKIQAWKLGPVIPSVYSEFKDHGKDNPIGHSVRAMILKDDDSGELEAPEINELTDERKAKSLFVACAAYGEKRAWNLVDILHGEKSAWKKNYKEGERAIIIPDEDIRSEFENYMDQIATFLLG
jgi:uncharacterized phage-associated protein